MTWRKPLAWAGALLCYIGLSSSAANPAPSALHEKTKELQHRDLQHKKQLQGIKNQTEPTTPTEQNPLQGDETQSTETLSSQLADLKAGDVIQLKAGVYSERLNLSCRGTAEQRIVIDGGGKVIIDGSSLEPRPDVGWDALIEIAAAQHLTLKGIELRNWRSSEPEHVPMAVLVRSESSHIQLQDLSIHHIEADRPQNAGEEAETSSKKQKNAHAIGVFGDSQRALKEIHIKNIQVKDCRLGASEAVVINGNVEDWSIVDSEVSHCNNIGIDVIGGEGIAPSAQLDVARSGRIANNRVHHIHTQGNRAYANAKAPSGYDLCAAGIYVDGGREVLIEGNRIFSCDIGIELASEHRDLETRDIRVLHNEIFNNGQCGVALGGYDKNRGSARNIELKANVLFKNGWFAWGAGELFLQHRVQNLEVQHNTFYASSWPPHEDKAVFVGMSSGASAKNVNFEHNRYFCDPKDAKPRWSLQRSDQKSKKIDAFWRWQQSGQDRWGVYGDPGFTSSNYEAGGISSGADKEPKLGSGLGLDFRLKSEN